MRKIYITEEQLKEALGMSLSYFNGSDNGARTMPSDSEISVNGNLSGETKVTTDKIAGERTPRTYYGARKSHTTINCSVEKKSVLKESNKDLEGDTYEIPNELFKILQSNLNSTKGKKNVDGIMRLKNLLKNRSISYNEMYRLKNHFENTPKQNSDYNLLGGEKMKRWIEQQLKSATNISKNTKDVKHMIGIENAYISKHTKDSNNGQAHTTKKNGAIFNYE